MANAISSSLSALPIVANRPTAPAAAAAPASSTGPATEAGDRGGPSSSATQENVQDKKAGLADALRQRDPRETTDPREDWKLGPPSSRPWREPPKQEPIHLPPSLVDDPNGWKKGPPSSIGRRENGGNWGPPPKSWLRDLMEAQKGGAKAPQ